jgi:WD40 repeat protein
MGMDPHFQARVDFLSLGAADQPYRIRTHGRDPFLTLWNTATQRTEWSSKVPPAWSSSVAFSPNGSRVAMGGCRELKPAHPKNVESIVRALRDHQSVRISGRSGALTPGGGVVKMWEAATGREIFSLNEHDVPVEAVGWGKCIVSIDRNAVLRLWDGTTGRILRTISALKGEEQASQPSSAGMAFSGDATRVVLLTDDPKERRRGCDLKQWDVLKNTLRRLTLPMGAGGSTPGSIALRPDGLQFVTGTFDHILTIHDFDTNEKVREFRPAAREGAVFLAYSPDGSRIVSGTTEGVVRLWDAGTGRLLRQIEGPKGFVRAVRFLPNRLRVASGGIEEQLKPGAQVAKIDPLVVWDTDRE